jgi:hypothetical protein
MLNFGSGVSIPIVPPAEFNLFQPDYALITAWNYAVIIIAQHPDFTGKWVTFWHRLRSL